MFRLLQKKASPSVVSPRLAEVPIRGLRSPTLSLPTTEVKRRPMYDVYGNTIGRLGVVHLNKEHRFNTLSPSFCTEVSRGISSMYEDRLTKAIFVAPAKGKHWSNGTDFRTMLAMKKEGSHDRLAEYLEQIYQLQTQVAKTNKPIIAAAPGHAFNSGATLLASCGYPMMTADSKMAFNECTFGFVPHSGATFYLSRLPSEFGTFLALTGLPIHGTDAAKLKLVDGILQTTKGVNEEVADAVYSMGYNPREFHEMLSLHENTIKKRHEHRSARRDSQIARNEKNMELDSNAGISAALQSMGDLKYRQRGFAEAHERQPSSIGDADGWYRAVLRAEQRKNQTPTDQGLLDVGTESLDGIHDFPYQRVYQPTMDYIKSHTGHLYQADKTVAVQHLEMIGRCFYSSSVAEIMQNLRDEGTPFALECLAAMERNSTLSMSLALKMLRQASNLDYVSCLNMEVKVASKMIDSKDFEVGVQQVLLSPKTDRGQKVPNAAKYTDSKRLLNLDSFFEGANWAKNINVGAMAHALLPTRHHYERFNDQVRLWINEESTHQEELRHFFDQDAKWALQELGVDVRDKALTMQIAREHLGAQLAQERREKVEHERMEQMMCDKKLRSIYFTNVDNEVAKLKKMNKKKFQANVDGCIQKVFENAYTERLQTMFDKSREAQSLERRRMYIRLKRFLFRSRCTTTGDETHQQQLKRIQNYTYKLPHLSESWETNWRDFSHPLIEKSPLFHLSKAIGRVQISPIELTREYLTNPQAREQLSMLTVDKKELLKIQEDLYAHPEKYHAMFTQKEQVDHGQSRHLWDPNRREDVFIRLSDYSFWHSMLNDGTEVGDNWPFLHEYNAYKHWFDSVEDRALNTLKVAVAQLLADFDDSNNKTFDGSNMSKKGQLEQLLNTFDGREEQLKQVKKEEKKARKARKMTSSKRDLDQIDELLDAAIGQDVHLKPLLSADASVEHNSVVQSIQKQARAQLLQMLEIVLLDKYGPATGDEKTMLKQRLAQLMTPQGMKRDELNHQQLKLIDSYLMNESGKATLKSAINLIKPAYLEYMQSLLLEHANALKQDLFIPETHHRVLLYHHMLKTNPGLSKSAAVQRLLTYSKQREGTDIFFNAAPTFSPTFRQRELMNQFAEVETQTYHAEISIEDQKARVEQQMKRQRAAMAQIDENLRDREAEFDREAAESLMPQNPEDDIRSLEFFWSEQHQGEFALIDQLQSASAEWLMQHKYEIDNHFTALDWLKIYADAIQNQDLNMNVTLQMTQNDHQGDVDATGKSDQEWSELASVARYMSDLRESLAKFQPEAMPELTPQSLNDDSQLSLWEMALQKKKQYVEARAQKKRSNRSQIIKDQLIDFNELQRQAQKRAVQAEKLEKLAESQPTRIQALINEAIRTPQTCIDYDKLTNEIQAGADPTRSGLAEFIDVDQLIQNIRAGQTGAKQFLTRLLDTPTDLQALADAKETAERDSSLSLVQQAQILSLVEHCSDQMQFVSNEQRQSITMGRFLNEHDASASASLRHHATNLLRKRLSKALGETVSDSGIVDWEVNGVRTSPLDHHLSDNQGQLDKIASGFDLASEQDEHVQLIDPATRITETRSMRDHAQVTTLRQAKQLTELPNDMEQYKNFYENKLLCALMQPGDNTAAQQDIIDEYTSLRLKTCMLNASFADKVHNSDDGHLYLKTLRERVLDELKLTQEAEVQDMFFKTMYEKSKDHIKYDVEAAYNMQDTNNTQALGYDNLKNRAGATDDHRTFESAHESVFDKMLADYYLAQRGEYTESNKLMGQLTDVFESKIDKETRIGEVIGKDRNQNLSLYKQMQDVEKQEAPVILPRQAKNIFELDVLTHRAIQGGKSGMSENLRQLSIADTDHPQHYTTQVPEYFDWMDVRLKPEKYVADKLQEVVNEAFETRRKLERNMNRRELLALDKVLAKYLEPETLLQRLEAAIDDDYSEIFTGRQMVEQARQQNSSTQYHEAREPNMQRKFNKKVKNPDALYKQLAMGAMMEVKHKQLMENPDHQTFKDKDAMFHHFTFERYYLEQLEKDSLYEPRAFESADFEPKKAVPGAPTEFLNLTERRDQFFDDHRLYVENKKEQQDRTKLFFVFEQFFEQSREKPDKMSAAQEHMREYFSDPDNTFFFDKNKIQ